MAVDLGVPGLPEGLSVPYSLLEAAFRSLRWHVQNMDQAELEYRGPDGTLNSTAMLLAHLAVVDLEYWHIIMGKPIPPELWAKYGPYHHETGQIPVVEGLSGEELLDRYRHVLDLGRGFLETQTETDAVREVKVPWWDDRATVRFVIWHMAGHAKYHEGHIARLQEWYKQERPA